MRKTWLTLLVLSLLLTVAAPLMAQASEPALVGTTWEWVSTTTPVEEIVASDPTHYQITFMEDGSVAALVDCNRAFGTYTLDGSSVSIQIVGMTMAMCPEGSQGDVFVQQLNNAAIFFFQDGDLYIDLFADGGTMQFTPAAPTLTGVVWEWTGTQTPVEEIGVAFPRQYQIEFLVDGTVAVKADCNRAFGTYTTADGGSITIEITGMTMAMCPEGSQGDLFVQQLNNAGIYFFRDGNLFIDQQMDSGTMQFRVEGSGPVADASQLIGTTWEWTDWMQANTAEAIFPRGAYSIVFNADGSVNITADCNVAFGTYTAADGAITIEVGGVTRAMCPPESRSQEFLDLLGQVTTYDFMPYGWMALSLPDDGGTMGFMEPGPTLTGTWQWVQTLTPDETIVAADPTRYTITFNEDGTFNWRVDCNTGGGGFTTDGVQSIEIGPGMMTLMGCPEDTQDFQFQQITNARIYFFMDGDLFFELADGAGIMQLTPAQPALTGTTWQWVQTVTPVETIVAGNPASYTVLFNDDGTYALQADCNSGGGSYTVDGQSISIGPAALTMMACPEGSQDGLFLQQLANAAIFFFLDGDLYMDQAMDSGTMQFTAAR